MKHIDESFYFKGTNNLGILLCHGLTGAPGEMKELGIALNKVGYTVKCIEYPGHGSNKDNFLNTNVYEWYKDLQKAFNELKNKVNGIYVMGLSMGGTFTVKIAEDYDVLGLVTMNAPLISMALKESLDTIKETTSSEIYEKQSYSYIEYNKFVTKIGQIVNLNKKTAPLLVVQGKKDTDRFKISSYMLTKYVNSKILKRLDFAKSGHLITTEEERYDLFEEIIKFLKEIEKKS